MSFEHYKSLMAKFRDARVLVVGDVYLDENVYGVVTGISLEAPIPVYEVHARYFNPGAAGNTACNIAALGARTHIIGVIGADANAGILRNEFTARKVDVPELVIDASRPTNTYGKLRSGGYNIPEQEVLRTDTPTPPFISGAIEDEVIENIWRRAAEVDAIVVVDQIASVATPRVLAAVVEAAAKYNLLTAGDSRGRAAAFKGFDVVTPNDREAGIATGVDVVDEATLRRAAKALLADVKNVVITRGPLGIAAFARDGAEDMVPVPPCRVVDVTGAGDTATAAVALTLLAGGSLADAAAIGNAAASVAVSKRGVVTVSVHEIEQVFAGDAGLFKLQSLDVLKRTVAELQAEGRRVVWTNGCFDILHVGHITYLQRAARLGDVLVVGLNSDESVRRLKGPERPIIGESERALVLSALECVGYVTIFSDESPLRLIDELKPDIYAKGGDYTIDTIDQNERHLVEGYGGSIALLPGVEGRSTTSIIGKIAKR